MRAGGGDASPQQPPSATSCVSCLVLSSLAKRICIARSSRQMEKLSMKATSVLPANHRPVHLHAGQHVVPSCAVASPRG